MEIELKTEYQIVDYAPDSRYIAHFVWRDTDPAALTVTFDAPANTSPVQWIFGRELLFDGISSQQKVGLGDVGINAVVDLGDMSQWFKISLSSPEGNAEVVLRSNEVLEFLQRTERALPTAIFEGSSEEKRIMHELDFAIESILTKAEGGQS